MPRLTATCAATNPGSDFDLARSKEIKSTSYVWQACLQISKFVGRTAKMSMFGYAELAAYVQYVNIIEALVEVVICVRVDNCV